ncbi:MAG: conserved rane protein of unknown function [Nitrososphaeraceae archaeon]|jgi:hypothetical protein|nr:conserved rane protein of unknown function [Nitrososphaeraceae archaeon]
MTKSDPKTHRIDDSTNADSNVLLTQYSSEASQLIQSFTKQIPFVVITLIVIAAMTTFDLVMDLGFARILPDETIDAMIISVSILLIIFLLCAIRPVKRSQKILDKWSNLFENNAIRTGILLSINNKSKEEILNALSETIEEIDIPLHQYISKSKQHNEFYNISIDDTSSTTFDILIDKSTINPAIDSSSLKNTIQDYGGILVKIIEKTIDKNTTQTFIESLQKYKMKKGNKIGLALLIGESIDQESYQLINKIKDKNIRENLIWIEKPDNPDLSLNALNNA